MQLVVLRELRGPTETPPAQPALEGPLLSMGPVVRGEVGALAEGSAAVTALVGAPAHGVACLPIADEVCLAAAGRWEGSHLRFMGLEVLTKVCVLHKSSAAVCTLMVLLILDSHSDTWERWRRVTRQRAGALAAEARHEDEAFPAGLTWRGPLPNVDLLLSLLKGHSGPEGSWANFTCVDSGLLQERLAHH